MNTLKIGFLSEFNKFCSVLKQVKTSRFKIRESHFHFSIMTLHIWTAGSKICAHQNCSSEQI